MTRTALLLSPHLDDAAFSCGATIAGLADDGWRCVVLTVFTASVARPEGFALACQLDKGLGADVDYMALRRTEDAAAMAILGAEPVWLDLPEAPHRGYGSAAALFGPLLPKDDVANEIATRLRLWIQRLDPDLVLAPQALGGHVDHLQVAHALRSLPAARPVLWWRDLPYAMRKPTAVSPVLPAAGLASVVLDAGPGLPRKLDACAAYASQIGFQFGGAAAMGDALARFASSEGASGVPCERFLAVPSAIPMVSGSRQRVPRGDVDEAGAAHGRGEAVPSITRGNDR